MGWIVAIYIGLTVRALVQLEADLRKPTLPAAYVHRTPRVFVREWFADLEPQPLCAACVARGFSDGFAHRCPALEIVMRPGGDRSVCGAPFDATRPRKQLLEATG